MHESLTLAPPNSLVLVMHPQFGAVPESFCGEAIRAAGSCIAVGTLCEIDGETTVHLCTPDEFFPLSGLSRRWSGPITTYGQLAVTTSSRDVLASMDVGAQLHVDIWTNAAS